MKKSVGTIKRVIIYIRVSTKLQETKFSLEGQRDDLTRYAKDQGWKIVNTILDVDSGGKLDKPGLNKLLDDVEEGLTDIVLVVDQDRLSRLDTVEWELLKSILRSNKVKIAEPGNIVDLDNEDDEFMSDLKNLLAKREKKKIVRRMMRGKRRRMREGKGFGKAPLGYSFNKETKTYEVDEEWSWVIPFIDDLYLNKQFGMMSIAKKLNDICRTPSGRFWNERLIQLRLTSKAFHGVMEKSFANGETISIDDMYPALRNEETFNKIQTERQKRGNQFNAYSRETDDLHLFRRTLFECGECGRKIALTQHGTKKSPRFYLKHNRSRRVSDQYVCDISINTVRIEPQVRKALADMLKGKHFAEQYVTLDLHANDLIEHEKTIKSLEKKINDLEMKKGRLLDLFLDGNFDKTMLTKKQDEIDVSLKQLMNQKIELSSKIKLLQSNSWGYKKIYEYLQVVDRFEEELSPLEQAQMFGELFPTGKLFRDKLVLYTMIEGVLIDFSVPISEDPNPNHSSKNRG
ncbi:recombinase family protein [Paenisporosarcina sp. OV554]|uniref:recombinase family protein n=1 Tax=Paenisporosarcina sp. OV554 TaxID=2135694 RepID=UPI000D46BC79|nr:recombinase family protein [Paenisporosarcina sp. OV554]PUB12584.1 DNA invertase Pin-like site-specific DNA recombinase [Paenisporosarcina sp. OV554]